MTLKRLSALLLALLLTAASALAAPKVIQPTEDFYVNDSANVLSDEVEGLIVLNNDKLYAACGAQIGRALDEGVVCVLGPRTQLEACSDLDVQEL